MTLSTMRLDETRRDDRVDIEHTQQSRSQSRCPVLQSPSLSLPSLALSSSYFSPFTSVLSLSPSLFLSPPIPPLPTFFSLPLSSPLIFQFLVSFPPFSVHALLPISFSGWSGGEYGTATTWRCDGTASVRLSVCTRAAYSQSACPVSLAITDTQDASSGNKSDAESTRAAGHLTVQMGTPLYSVFILLTLTLGDCLPLPFRSLSPPFPPFRPP